VPLEASTAAEPVAAATTLTPVMTDRMVFMG
jgi:hypothetical protein